MGRREDRRLVTGQGRFTADWHLPGQVYATFVRSDQAHARIKSIDVASARAMSGVLAVLTGDDVSAAGFGSPQPMNPGPGKDQSALSQTLRPALAHQRVRYVGEPVALVVAQSEAIAQDAAELISVDYDELPIVVEAADAARPGAPLLHDDIAGNLAFDFEVGDEAETDAAFANADHIVGLSLNAHRISGTPMEPKACAAVYDAAADSFDVYMQTQGMADIVKAFAHITGQPTQSFRIHAHDVGGAFGVRGEVYPENAAIVLAAKLVGRPVKWVGSRSETFLSDHHGRGAEMTGQLALDRDGTFVGLRVEWLVNMGAYLSLAGALINTVAAPRSMSSSIYKVPTLYVRNRLVLTNLTPATAYRGAGRPNVAYLWERLIDEAARATGIDRISLRRRNLIPKAAFPYTTPAGSVYDSADPEGLLDKVLAEADWSGFEARRAEAAGRGRLRGIGCATFIEPSGAVGQEEIAIRFDTDGRPVLYTLAGPSGQGYETVYQDIVAKTLGLDADTMLLRSSDPDGPALVGTGSYGSRSLISHGSALLKGAEQVIAKGRELAARQLEVAAADVTFEAGRYVVKGTDVAIGMADLIAKHVGSGPHPLDTTTKIPVGSAFPSGAHVAEVEIDPQTGEIEIVNYTAVDDCGVIYNHQIVEGQLQGGLVQGLGQVMGEQCVYDRETGQLLTGSFMDYVMPRVDALRRLATFDRPMPSPANPLGAKGAGEAGTTGAVPTLANAVHDALAPAGVDHLEMPYTPDRVWSALQDAKG